MSNQDELERKIFWKLYTKNDGSPTPQECIFTGAPNYWSSPQYCDCDYCLLKRYMNKPR